MGWLGKLRLYGLAPAGVEMSSTLAKLHDHLFPIMHAATLPYRPDIDGLRALAVLGVLVYHAFPAALPGGFAGVDLFFVISGYLITGILARSLREGTFSLADFYARRVRRLFPALIVVLLAAMALGAVIQLPGDYARLGRNVSAGAAFVANLALGRETGYFTGVAESNPLLHLWSLGIEEQFYLAWPLILWAAFRLRRFRGGVLWALVLLSLGYSAYLVDADRNWAFYSPFSRFWELGAGGLLALASMDGGSRPRRLSRAWGLRRLRGPSSIAGVALIGLSFVWLRPGGWFPGFGALPAVLGALLLLGCGPDAWLNRHLLRRRLLVWIGLISYPLYLWHWPILAFANTALTDVPPRYWSWMHAAGLALSLLLAWLTYRYVESPVRQRPIRRRAIAGLGAAMACTAVLGLWLWHAQGVPARIAPSVRPLVAANLLDGPWRRGIGEGSCHNQVYAGSLAGPDRGCFPAGHPSVLLWGDSSAAALSAGLRPLQGPRGFVLWQATTDATAPLFDDSRRNNMQRTLSSINDTVLQQLRGTPPDVVLLHAFWPNAADSPDALLAQLGRTRDIIRSAWPHARVVVLGPLPFWRFSLQQNILNYSVRHGKAPAGFMRFGLLSNAFEYDRAMAAGAQRLGLAYLSAVDLMCNPQEGCLARLGPAAGDLTYVDGLHLSAAGARYLAERLLDGFGTEIFGQ